MAMSGETEERIVDRSRTPGLLHQFLTGAVGWVTQPTLPSCVNLRDLWMLNTESREVTPYFKSSRDSAKK